MSYEATILTFVGDDPKDVHYVEVRVSQRRGLAGPAGTTYVACNCPLGQEYWVSLKQSWTEPVQCWAMDEARTKLGLPELS